jgi:hypothetical protein
MATGDHRWCVDKRRSGGGRRAWRRPHWLGSFEGRMGRIAGRFARVEPRQRAQSLVLGRLSGLPRKNCRTITGHTGHARHATPSPPPMNTLDSQPRQTDPADLQRDPVPVDPSGRPARPQPRAPAPQVPLATTPPSPSPRQPLPTTNDPKRVASSTPSARGTPTHHCWSSHPSCAPFTRTPRAPWRSTPKPSAPESCG